MRIAADHAPAGYPASVRTGLTLLAAGWAGAMLGVSFLAAPAKFTVAALTLPVALEVGRATFHLFHGVELGLLAAMALLAALPGGRAAILPVLGLCLLVLAQQLGLTPAMDARIAAIAAGEAVPPSRHHLAYVALELGKLALALWTALSMQRDLQRDCRHLSGGGRDGGTR